VVRFSKLFGRWSVWKDFPSGPLISVCAAVTADFGLLAGCWRPLVSTVAGRAFPSFPVLVFNWGISSRADLPNSLQTEFRSVRPARHSMPGLRTKTKWRFFVKPAKRRSVGRPPVCLPV
jgi:hypothetical protein